MGFWLPSHWDVGFQTRIAPGSSSHLIYYYEAYAVLSAFHWILHTTAPPPKRVVIYSDSSNTCGLFRTLRAPVDENPIALTAADLMLRFGCQLRVAHVAGEQNVVADALSRFDNNTAHMYRPYLVINDFQPPQLLLGAALS
ncbi:hypothetical protein HYPSUDRAFT_140868 [Hypholoma sublateritium FD-334 SS-4]|uniref:RNase H type-1 domain-containing protein n=1 Tax=Hypholoma sublateritium (strain FD-334 SS-4) TaxID=945553 RepID=A0A0D2NXZ7_HYPSF|nr:hypothetical protein HYPSUDRAFT_140868 [Hypholoma sublateritium FD-334 SS-4]